MVMPDGMYFTSLTHGKNPDCRLANASLRERLEDYNFGNFVVEQNCWKCPNNICNLSFVLILSRTEFSRLRNQVRFDTRPTFLVHHSFKELLGSDTQIRVAVERREIGIQNVPEMSHISIDAIPDVKAAVSQTDLRVRKQDTGIQTEEGQLSRSVQEDDDVVFIEMRVAANRAVKKEEEDEEDVGSDSVSSKSRSEDSYQSAQSVEAVEQPVEPVEPEHEPEKESAPEVKTEPMEVASPVPPPSVFNTPKSLIRTPDSQSSGCSSAKRRRLMDVDHCEVCWFDSEDNSLAQYCHHVLDCHVTIFRFKCNHCALRFTDSRRAKFHLNAAHSVDVNSDNQYTVEIARDQLSKFMKCASNCYPEKFRGISFDALEETLLSLP